MPAEKTTEHSVPVSQAAIARRLADMRLLPADPVTEALVRSLIGYRRLVIVWDPDSAVSKSMAFTAKHIKNPMVVWTPEIGFQTTDSYDNV